MQPGPKGRDQHQMIVVAHQAAGRHPPSGFPARLGQRLYEVVPIHAIQENVLAQISWAEHVIHGTGILNPWFAQRGLLFALLPSKVNTKANHTAL
jgi:hypothetical protein